MKSHHYISLALLGMLLVLLPLGQLQSQSLKRLKKELKVWVKLDGAWGLIDGNQQWIIEPNTNYEDCINMYDGMAIMELKNDSKDDLKSFQVINLSGDTLLEFKALQAQFFDHFPTIRIETNSGYGCINLQGDTLVAPIYRRVSEDISDSTQFIISNNERQYGLIDSRGNILIPIIYKSLMTAFKDRYIARIKKNLEEILVSSSHEIISKISFESLFPISSENAIYSEVSAISGNDEYLLRSKDASEIFPTMRFIGFAGDPTWVPFQEGKQQGYKNRKGKILFVKQSEYTFLEPFSEKRAVYIKKSDQVKGYSPIPDKGYGVINMKGKEIVPPIYGFISPFNNGLASCLSNSKYGFINRKGKLKIPLEYEYASNSSKKKLLSVSKNGKQGLLNYRGKIITPITYASIISIFNDNYLLVIPEEGRMGIIDYQGREILPEMFDEIQNFRVNEKIAFKDFDYK